MSTLSTHVLDSVRGVPASGMTVVLIGPDGEEIETAFAATVTAGAYGLYFETGPWFAATGRETFYPAVTIGFDVDPDRAHHHVPLLLSPFAYTTYRGS
jgi:5-hydroxyisourate hydrolase